MAEHRITKKTGVLIGLFVAALFALVVWSSMGIAAVRVEVCMAYQGHSACRVASGADKATALRTASENACSQISSGMTDSMACDSSTPVSVKWLSGN